MLMVSPTHLNSPMGHFIYSTYPAPLEVSNCRDDDVLSADTGLTERLASSDEMIRNSERRACATAFGFWANGSFDKKRGRHDQQQANGIETAGSGEDLGSGSFKKVV